MVNQSLIRQAIERAIAKKTIRAILERGYSIVVNNGEERMQPSNDGPTILASMFTTDQDCLEFGNYYWILLIYGNHGTDVISDYHVRCGDLLAPVNAFAEQIEAGQFDIVASA